MTQLNTSRSKFLLPLVFAALAGVSACDVVPHFRSHLKLE
jgi:hypothetical protein